MFWTSVSEFGPLIQLARFPALRKFTNQLNKLIEHLLRMVCKHVCLDVLSKRTTLLPLPQACQNDWFIIIMTWKLRELSLCYRVVTTRWRVVWKRILDIEWYVVSKEHRRPSYLCLFTSAPAPPTTALCSSGAANQSLIPKLTRIRNTILKTSPYNLSTMRNAEYHFVRSFSLTCERLP